MLREITLLGRTGNFPRMATSLRHTWKFKVVITQFRGLGFGFRVYGESNCEEMDYAMEPAHTCNDAF